jgi:hypothetical protein
MEGYIEKGNGCIAGPFPLRQESIVKKSRFVVGLVLLWAAALSGASWAHDRHRGPRVGVFIGAPLGYYWYGPPPYYYYPPPVIVRPEPQVYIEKAAPVPAPQARSYWHYCTSPQGYYPYVKDCPGGWLQVVPTPMPPN